jgi:hypothetical protein
MFRVLLFYLTFSGSCVHDKQIVQSWAGWISLTSELQDQTSFTVEYTPPINARSTKMATVQNFLEISSVSKAVNQQYTFVTFDLAAAKRHIM